MKLSPVTRGGLTARAWSEKTMGEVGLNEALAVARERAQAAAAGDLDAAKGMLMAQALALDAIFNDMASRAASQIKAQEGGGWTFTKQTMDDLTRIAFKAQSQCRATLQTLGELVHPRSVAFIRADQANVASGHQQVNNGAASGGAPAPAQPTSGANKLLEANPSERLDFGTAAAAGRGDQALEAVGTGHRTQDAGRQGGSRTKRDKAR